MSCVTQHLQDILRMWRFATAVASIEESLVPFEFFPSLSSDAQPASFAPLSKS